MSKDRDCLFNLANIGREKRARETCPDCGPKIRAEKPARNPVPEENREIESQHSFMGYTGTKEEIDKLKEFQAWWNEIWK